MITVHQSAALVYRAEENQLQVLLVTSRETKRWIIPKGNIEAGKTALEAARQEALEEAGIAGLFHSEIPLGFYMYFKKRADGSTVPASVEVYLMQAVKAVKNFREKGERKQRWVPIDRAITKIQEPGLIPILRRLRDMAPQLLAPDVSVRIA